MAKAMRLLVLILVFGFVMSKAQANSGDRVALVFKKAPFKELIGHAMQVRILSTTGDGLFQIAVPAKALTELKCLKAPNTQPYLFTWIANENRESFGRFYLKPDDFTILTSSTCDQSRRFCEGMTVLDPRSAEPIDPTFASWEFARTPIFRILSIQTNTESGQEFVLLSNGQIRTPETLIRLRCTDESSTTCEVATP